MVKKSGKIKKNSFSQMEAAGNCSDTLFGEELGVDDFDEDGFIEGDVNTDNAVAVFSFGMPAEPDKCSTATEQQHTDFNSVTKPTQATGPNRGAIKGLTPPIDGEAFSLRRGYQFRPSTVRKLNELKSKHPDVNVYLNTILDAAILHYCKYIINENGWS